MSEVDMLFTRTTDDVPSHNSPWFFSIDDLRPGACGGELACSTCHLIFPKDVYDTLPPMEDDEVDMLDLAFEVTETSRLGCQIMVRKDMAGMKVRELCLLSFVVMVAAWLTAVTSYPAFLVLLIGAHPGRRLLNLVGQDPQRYLVLTGPAPARGSWEGALVCSASLVERRKVTQCLLRPTAAASARSGCRMDPSFVPSSTPRLFIRMVSA
jgi:hypothetical protein